LKALNSRTTQDLDQKRVPVWVRMVEAGRHFKSRSVRTQCGPSGTGVALERLRAYARGAFEAGDPVRIRIVEDTLMKAEAEIASSIARERSEHGPRRPAQQGEGD